MRKALLALMIAALGTPAFAQSYGGSSDGMSNGPGASTVNEDSGTSNQTDSDQPLEQAPNDNPSGQTGLDNYEQVPGSGLSGAQNQSGTDFNSTLPDLGTPSPTTPSTAEGPSSNTGPTLPDSEQDQNPAPNP